MPAATSITSPIDAVVAHHAEMVRELRTRVDHLVAAVAFGDPASLAVASVADYFQVTVFPHAASEEATLYAAASRFEQRLVDSLILEHRALYRLVSELATVSEPSERAATAGAIAELFALHVAKENEFILPTLVERAPDDVAGLVHSMHEEFERQLLPRAVTELDVREIPHAARHDQIFGRLEGLSSGESLIIVNDHDPAPLHYQLDALWPATFSWSYDENGPKRWRVAITRRGSATT